MQVHTLPSPYPYRNKKFNDVSSRPFSLLRKAVICIESFMLREMFPMNAGEQEAGRVCSHYGACHSPLVSSLECSSPLPGKYSLCYGLGRFTTSKDSQAELAF